MTGPWGDEPGDDEDGSLPVHPALADADGGHEGAETPGARAERHVGEVESRLDTSDASSPHALLGVLGHGLLAIEARLRSVAGEMRLARKELERIRKGK